MLILLVFFGFYVGGWHSQKIDLLDPTRLYRITQQATSFLSIFTALIGLLLITHEFRYNLASYSLSLSRSRSKVLAAKIIVISVLALVVTGILVVAAPLLADWGIHANHLKLVPQHYYYWGIAWKGLIYGWGYGMAGLVIGTLLRNQIGAIITLFIVPHTVEGLLSIWLKNNTVYLPFTSLDTVLGVNESAANSGPIITPVHALLVFLAYLVGAWIIAWYLFMRRDAA